MTIAELYDDLSDLQDETATNRKLIERQKFLAFAADMSFLSLKK